MFSKTLFNLVLIFSTISFINIGCEEEEEKVHDVQIRDMMPEDEQVAGEEEEAEETEEEAEEAEEAEDVEAGEEQLDCEPEFQEEDGCVEPEPVVDPACESCEGEECSEDCDDNVEPQEGEEG